MCPCGGGGGALDGGPAPRPLPRPLPLSLLAGLLIGEYKAPVHATKTDKAAAH